MWGWGWGWGSSEEVFVFILFFSLVGSSTSRSLSDKIIIMNDDKEFFVSLASNHLKIPEESQKFYRSVTREQVGPKLSFGGARKKQKNCVILVVSRDSNFKCRVAL